MGTGAMLRLARRILILAIVAPRFGLALATARTERGDLVDVQLKRSDAAELRTLHRPGAVRLFVFVSSMVAAIAAFSALVHFTRIAAFRASVPGITLAHYGANFKLMQGPAPVVLYGAIRPAHLDTQGFVGGVDQLSRSAGNLQRLENEELHARR
jgi:hypothetical protein